VARPPQAAVSAVGQFRQADWRFRSSRPGAGRLSSASTVIPTMRPAGKGFSTASRRTGIGRVAPAQRGYWPDGAAPDGSYRASATGQDALDLIEALGRDRADLIVTTFGARAAYAAANLDATRVASLSVCGPLWPSTANRLARRR